MQPNLADVGKMWGKNAFNPVLFYNFAVEVGKFPHAPQNDALQS